jgi:hypothetical protein
MASGRFTSIPLKPSSRSNEGRADRCPRVRQFTVYKQLKIFSASRYRFVFLMECCAAGRLMTQNGSLLKRSADSSTNRFF